jgi:hypothetical protein
MLVVLAACVWAAGGGAQDPPARSVLFVGNSLTYANDLPAMLRRVAGAAGRKVRVAMVAAPDLAVIDHTTGATDAPRKIARGQWDAVVLQQGPTPAGICRDTLVIAAMRLAPAIRASGGRPALFLPWSRRGFPASLDPAAASATAAARAVGGAVVPTGIAWRKALEADPALPLYSEDGYHPAPAGTLLAALTLYDRLLGGDVRGIPVERLLKAASVSLTPEQLRTLAAAAHAAASEWPPDPATPVPADTTHLSATGGPC